VSESELVSVVIPTHNRAALVTKAIDSVLAQVGAETQVIVVDDDSVDDSQNILAGYGEAIAVIHCSPGVERGAARNVGAASGRGHYVAFLDSDDCWEPHKLERQIASMGADSVSLTGLRHIDEKGAETGECYLPPPLSANRLILENPFLGSPSSLLMRYSTFNLTGGFPEELEVQGSEDWLFLLKLRKMGIGIDVVPEHLVRYRIHSGNFTSDPDRVARCMWAATHWASSRDLVTERDLMQMRGRTAGVLGRQFASHGRWREAFRWIATALHEGSLREVARALPLVTGAAIKRIMKRTAQVGGHRA
jgi:GT2 family glycosyltransferase